MTLKLGIIGLGRVAWLLERDPLRGKPCTHLGAWALQESVELVAVCDKDSERLAEFEGEHPGVEGFFDFREMFRAHKLDLLSICAYADTRAEMIVAACAAGVRGIWAEKAIATTLSEAQEIADCVESHDVALALSHPRRWSPLYQWVAHAIQSGELGQVEMVTAHFSGNLAHTGTHAIDILRMWLGDPDYCTGWLEDGNYQVSESGYQFGVPEQVGSPDVGGMGLLEFPNSVKALLSGKSKSYFRFEFEIITDQNLLRVGNTQRELWLRGPSPLFEGFTELKKGEFAKLDALNVFSEIARQLAHSVSTQTRPRPRMLCNELDGLMALKTVLALHESQRRGSTPVHLQTLRSDIKLISR